MNSKTPIPDRLPALWCGVERTPLFNSPLLAAHCNVARVLVKDEGQRPLGNFKTLGGFYAALKALTRAAGDSEIETYFRKSRAFPDQTLMCASDGNHGLAVAAAARLAGIKAIIFLHERVSETRANRLLGQGAELIWIQGTYDDAVYAAERAAQSGMGLLVADTTEDEHEAVIEDILNGYEVIAEEISNQLHAFPNAQITHVFVQAGVGGLAAAMARGLAKRLPIFPKIVIVEPNSARCVGAALSARKVEQIAGDLSSTADMLSCGRASASALRILLQYEAVAIGVTEDNLAEGCRLLREMGGPATTPSGAAGLAGLLSVLPGSELAKRLAINGDSQILIIATEGSVSGSVCERKHL